MLRLRFLDAQECIARSNSHHRDCRASNIQNRHSLEIPLRMHGLHLVIPDLYSACLSQFARRRYADFSFKATILLRRVNT